MQTNAPSRLALTAMSGFGERSTGIPGIVIWLNPGDGGAHGPRIKVSNVRGKARFENKDCFSVSIPANPTHVAAVVAGTCELNAKDLKRVLNFVSNNRQPLLQIWSSEVLPDEVTFVKS